MSDSESGRTVLLGLRGLGKSRTSEAKTVFSQVFEPIHPQSFRRCVEKYMGNHRVKIFSCWDQFLCMAYGQLAFRESVRDTVACLRSRREGLYRMIEKALPATMVRKHTAVSLAWVAQRLAMGHPSSASRARGSVRESKQLSRKLRLLERMLDFKD